jgi:HlyD family secretion protein
MAAVAEVDQADAPRLALGDRAGVQVLDRTVEGKVTRIGTIVGRNLVANPDPRALQDRRVLKVSVTLDDPALAARLVNMEVDVTFHAGTADSAGR